MVIAWLVLWAISAADTEFFKAEGRPDTRPAAAGESPLGARVRGVFQPQQKDTDKDTKDANKDGAKDDKAGKSGKAPATPAKPNPPAPLKPDGALSTESAK